MKRETKERGEKGGKMIQNRRWWKRGGRWKSKGKEMCSPPLFIHFEGALNIEGYSPNWHTGMHVQGPCSELDLEQARDIAREGVGVRFTVFGDARLDAGGGPARPTCRRELIISRQFAETPSA